MKLSSNPPPDVQVFAGPPPEVQVLVEGIMARNRALFGTGVMVDGSEGTPAPQGNGGKAPEQPKPEDKPDGNAAKAAEYGFPPNTPLAEMTDSQQAGYWRAQSRKHEDTVKARGDYDQLKADSAALGKIRADSATEAEKAIAAARQEERMALAPSLVGAEFRAAAKGVLTDTQRDALLEDLDLTKYLTDKGQVDVAKVEKKVAAMAPPVAPDASKRKFPDLGQGNRNGKPKQGVSAGRDMFADRHPSKAS